MKTLPPHQSQAYQTDGFFIWEQLIADEDLSQIHHQIQHALTSFDTSPLKEHYVFEKNSNQPRKLMNYARHVEELWRSFLTNPKLISIAKAILGNNILLKYDAVFAKLPGGGEAPWHQDIALWDDTNSDALNFWMALTPTHAQNGCLRFVPKSHLGPIVTHKKYDDKPHKEIPRQQCKHLNSVAIELNPGDCAVWHSHLWHQSNPNTSNDPRIGIACVMMTPDHLPYTHEPSYPWLVKEGKIQEFPAPLFQRSSCNM